MASNLPHSTLSYKLESHINAILEHENTGASVTIRSFSREVYKEYLWVTSFDYLQSWLFEVFLTYTFKFQIYLSFKMSLHHIILIPAT